MFVVKTLDKFVKDSFVAPLTSVIKKSNIFQKNSVYPKIFIYTTFYYWLLHSYKVHNIVSQEIAGEIVIHSTKKVILTNEGLQLILYYYSYIDS